MAKQNSGSFAKCGFNSVSSRGKKSSTVLRRYNTRVQEFKSNPGSTT